MCDENAVNQQVLGVRMTAVVAGNGDERPC